MNRSYTYDNAKTERGGGNYGCRLYICESGVQAAAIADYLKTDCLRCFSTASCTNVTIEDLTP